MKILFYVIKHYLKTRNVHLRNKNFAFCKIYLNCSTNIFISIYKTYIIFMLCNNYKYNVCVTVYQLVYNLKKNLFSI